MMTNKASLNGAAQQQTAKIFSGSGQAQRKQKAASTAPAGEKKVKEVKQVFSFRGEKNNVKAWRLYASITGTKVDELGTLALQEYIKAHPLKGTEKQLFDEKLKS